MEIRIKVDDKFMNRLQENLKVSKASDVTREALALLNWATNESKNGRYILTADKDGNDVHRLCSPVLEKASSG